MKKTVKELREERGLTQLQLAVKIGTSISTIHSIESGRREPRFGTAKRLAEFFGLELGDIAWPDPNAKNIAA